MAECHAWYSSAVHWLPVSVDCCSNGYRFLGCVIYVYFVYFVSHWSVESFPFMFWRWHNKLKWAPFKFFAPSPLLRVRSWQDEGIIYGTGHTLLNRRCTKLPGCICLQNDLYCVGWGVKVYLLTQWLFSAVVVPSCSCSNCQQNSWCNQLQFRMQHLQSYWQTCYGVIHPTFCFVVLWHSMPAPLIWLRL